MPAYREGIYFISLSAQAENFTSASALISHFASAKYFTKTVSERTNLSVKNVNPSFSYPIDMQKALASASAFCNEINPLRDL